MRAFSFSHFSVILSDHHTSRLHDRPDAERRVAGGFCLKDARPLRDSLIIEPLACFCEAEARGPGLAFDSHQTENEFWGANRLLVQVLFLHIQLRRLGVEAAA